MTALYDICFAGEILEGQDIATVRLKLARLFKADEATVDKLFSGKTQMLKRGCDHETALKYQKAIKQAGAKPVIRSTPASQDQPPVNETRPEESMTAAQRIARLAAAADVAHSSPAPRAVEPEQTPSAEQPDNDIDLAPPGSDVLRPEERPTVATADIDVSAIELMNPGTDLSDTADRAPPAPDTSHLSMGEVGDAIPTLPSTAEQLSPDTSGIMLSPEHSDFSDCAPPPPDAPEVDLSGLDVAPTGADMLEAVYRPELNTQVPPTNHLELADESDPGR